jgi:hypothetical protein
MRETHLTERPARAFPTHRPMIVAVLVAAIATALLVPAAASAAVNVLDANSSAHLAKIKKARCHVKGKRGHKEFTAVAHSTNGTYILDINIIKAWKGFHHDYALRYGDEDPNFFMSGPGGPYSNAYPFPGQPPGAAGYIKFAHSGKKLAIGAYAAPNADFSQGVAFAGTLACR